MEDRIPVTLISGFLGSGKTTLVNRLLREKEGLFVLVNEFGEVPLDHRLVEGRAEALAEGCLCCGLQEELVAALVSLHRQGGFSHLLLETSGLAHPVPILQVLLAKGVRDVYRIAGMVTLVDPLHLDQYLGFPEAVAQIRYAGLILIGKADRASREELASAEAKVGSLNPAVPVLRSFSGQGVPLEQVLFPRRNQGSRILTLDSGPMHREGVRAVSLEAQGAVPYEGFRRFMEELVLSRGIFRQARLFRAKGEVNLEGSRHSLRFHGVFGLFDFEKGPPWPDGPRWNRLVFIGEGLEEAAIRERFLVMLRP